MTTTARLWCVLGFFGHHRVKILNGVSSAWQTSGLSVTKERPSSTSGNFDAKEDPTRVVDKHGVNTHVSHQNFTLIDSIEALRYLGREEPIDPVAGHIPGAVNAPWQLE
ncbi:MAG: thiosulfate/3-mercaptopyruvate sulfurtransferase [Porticoccus sp.]|jgi:thiosulfate/3-mercaptopyruvate sulfurtransferase